jgi:poly(A) polymerase
VRLREAPWQRTRGMARLLAALGADEQAIRFVGGCVRDTLLGLPVSDVDLATRLTPDEVIARLGKAKLKAIPTGIAHGTVTAVVEGKPVEITTLRRDVATDGRRATIAYTDDWRDDAARRDFTINALSADPASLEIHDYFNGLPDLEARRVRFIGNALTRIAEDHLRILRFFRFHARFGRRAPDAEGLAACAARANDLMALSRERIADELLKLLSLPDPVETVGLMLANGIFAPVLPEIASEGVERLRGLVQREQAADVAPDGIRRLGALLPADDAIAAAVAARLRLSKAQRLRLLCIADRGESLPDDPRAAAYVHGLPCAVDLLLLAERFSSAEARARVRALDGWQRPKLPVGGGQLIARGLPAGPTVAKSLQAIERAWIAAGFPTGDEVRSIVDEELAQALRARQ